MLLDTISVPLLCLSPALISSQYLPDKGGWVDSQVPRVDYIHVNKNVLTGMIVTPCTIYQHLHGIQ